MADASLLPRSLGNPPILTILALARRVARAARDEVLGAGQTCSSGARPAASQVPSLSASA